MQLGNQKQDTRTEHLLDAVDADFYQMFEFETTLPGDSLLRVEVKDWDGKAITRPGLPKIPGLLKDGVDSKRYELPVPFGADEVFFDDLVGATEIDLEDRVFSRTWNMKHKIRPPIEWRALYAPTSTTPQGTLEMWLEIHPKAHAEQARPPE